MPITYSCYLRFHKLPDSYAVNPKMYNKRLLKDMLYGSVFYTNNKMNK